MLAILQIVVQRKRWLANWEKFRPSSWSMRSNRGRKWEFSFLLLQLWVPRCSKVFMAAHLHLSNITYNLLWTTAKVSQAKWNDLSYFRMDLVNKKTFPGCNLYPEKVFLDWTGCPSHLSSQGLKSGVELLNLNVHGLWFLACKFADS